MDAPPIQYARTKDGANIAFWAIGEGPPLVWLPVLTASHIQAEWQTPFLRAAYERLATRSTLVRYNCRGMGLSQHDNIDFSVEAAILDLEAVAERLGLSQFAVYSTELAGDLPFAFAARHPERLTHLVHLAWSPPGRTNPQQGRHYSAIQPLMETDWDLYVEIVARLAAGWDGPDASALASLVRASHTPESLRQMRSQLANPSRESYLSEITVPTLILYPSADVTSQGIATSLAAGIRNGRLMGVPGDSPVWAPFPNDAGISAILDFVNTKPLTSGAPIAAPELDTSVFRAVVWTDLEAHTPIMQRLGDAKGREVLREHERVTREALREYGGTEVKAMGDGFMASFPSVQKALECAIALQESFASREIGGERLRCRIGINAGEPIQEEGDLFGTAVITAARIAGLAKGGEVLVSDVVRQLVAGKGFAFENRGEQPLKGISEPVRVWAVVEGS